MGAEAIGDRAVRARWRLGESGTFIVVTNLDLLPVSATMPLSMPLFGVVPADGCVPPDSTLAWVVP
jgi:hypothetical protein